MTEPNLGRLEFDLNEKPVVMLGISTNGEMLTIECVPKPKVVEGMSQAKETSGTRLRDDFIPTTQIDQKSELLLFNVLGDGYSLDELSSVAFKLGIDFDNIGGETKEAKARELIKFAKRYGKLKELFEMVRKDRPWQFYESRA